LADLSDENSYPHRAIGMRQVVVALLRRSGIPNSLPLAAQVVKLGAALSRVGLPEHAATAVSEAVEITGRLPHSTQAHADYLVQFAPLLAKLGQHERAETALRKALRLERSIHGEKDQHIVPALTELGNLYCLSSRYDEAFTSFEDAYQIQVRAGGPSDAKVGLILASYAECLRKAGRLEPAEDAAERAVKLLEMNLHPSLASGLGTLGAVLLAEGNYSEAVDAFERAGAAAVFAEGSISPLDTAERLESHADALEHLHRALDAEHLRSGASSIRSTLAAVPPAEELFSAELEGLLQSTEWPPRK
jgi:tetratricopeptide (TPR) repeat protein